MLRLPYANITIEHWNPGATMPMVMPVQLIANVPDEMIRENVRANSRLPYVEWLAEREPHGIPAVMCGSGPSLADFLGEIRKRQSDGAHVFAMNGAASFLADHQILPDYQVLLDARVRTAELIGPAAEHLFSSQVHPECFRRVPDAKMWHLAYPDIDELLPGEQPPHFILGGGAAVGNTAMVLANALGYRVMHVYGYDSSNREDRSHARYQAMNEGEPTCDVTFNGKSYRSSLTMKYQAERFQVVARALKQAGCEIHVHGDGLLPDMFNAPQEVLDEAEKYRRMWEIESYRVAAPGETCVATFLEVVKPEGRVIDFGCGTGRAAVKMKEAGLDVFTVDLVDNCRDTEALTLPFFKHDMREPFGWFARFGFCTDMMEHIPPESVEAVIKNIMRSAKKTFFQISTVPDQMGLLIGQPLHLTVRPFHWWRDLFLRLGYVVEWEDHDEIACQLVVSDPRWVQ